MLRFVRVLSMGVVAGTLISLAVAQGPRSADDPAKKDQKQKESTLVTKLMSYSKKTPGKVSRDEVTDERLLRLFDMADTNKEGVVTKDQLIAAAAKLEADVPQGGGRGGPGGGGPGGPGGGGRGGPGGGGGGPGGPGGGFGGRGGPPQMGVIMPDFMQEELKLTEEQKKQVSAIQKEVEVKLEKLLTAEQKKQYKEMKDNMGRGGPGGPGGRGGPGGGPGGRGGPDGPGGDRGRDGPPPEGARP